MDARSKQPPYSALFNNERAKVKITRRERQDITEDCQEVREDLN